MPTIKIKIPKISFPKDYFEKLSDAIQGAIEKRLDEIEYPREDRHGNKIIDVEYEKIN